MSYLARVAARLAELDARTLRRTICEHRDDVLDFSSNDYLGLARDPQVLAALHAAARVGSGGSRLLAGAHREHAKLEAELAHLVRREAALLFSSGYLAAIGAIGALAGVVASAYSDAANHACLIDGLRLAKLPRTVYPHRSLLSRETRTTPALVVSETVFGMDGDAIDVAALVAQLGPDDVAILDEAHALGIAGSDGGGLAVGVDDPRIVVIGTLSKALGALGGFVAGPAPVIEYLRHAARTFIFDTALPPALAEAARVAVRLVREDRERRARLHAAVTRLRAGLRAAGFVVDEAPGAVVPVIVGGASEALAAARELDARGIHVPAIRPPTVPAGSSRLRVVVRADHSLADVDALLAGLRAVSLAPVNA